MLLSEDFGQTSHRSNFASVKLGWVAMNNSHREKGNPVLWSREEHPKKPTTIRQSHQRELKKTPRFAPDPNQLSVIVHRLYVSTAAPDAFFSVHALPPPPVLTFTPCYFSWTNQYYSLQQSNQRSNEQAPCSHSITHTLSFTKPTRLVH